MCAADATVEADTLRDDFTIVADTSAPGDKCPETFWLRVKDPGSVFTHEARKFLAGVRPTNPPNEASCARPFSLFSQ